MHNWATFIAAALFLAPAATAAEPQPHDFERSSMILIDPQQRSALRTALSALGFSIDQEKKTAAAQIGTERDRWSLLLGLSAPVEATPRTVLATEEGLETKTTAEIAAKYTWWRTPLTSGELKRICNVYVGKDSCSRDDLPDKGRAEFDNRDVWRAWLGGVSMKGGRRDFSFIAHDGEREESRDGWSAAISGGLIPASPRIVYSASLTWRHESAYEGAPEDLFCTPIAAPEGTLCRPVALSPPERKEKNLMELEVRRFFGEFLAISPRLIFEERSRVWSIEVPLFIRTDAGGGFSGGLSAGWDSKNEFRASVFVGAMGSLTR